MASRDHGHTPAAWTAVLIILAGIFIGAFAVSVMNWPVFWAGAGVILLGLIVGKVMQMMGLGKSATADDEQPEAEHVSADAEHASAERDG